MKNQSINQSELIIAFVDCAASIEGIDEHFVVSPTECLGERKECYRPRQCYGTLGDNDSIHHPESLITINQ